MDFLPIYPSSLEAPEASVLNKTTAFTFDNILISRKKFPAYLSYNA